MGRSLIVNFFKYSITFQGSRVGRAVQRGDIEVATVFNIVYQYTLLKYKDF